MWQKTVNGKEKWKEALLCWNVLVTEFLRTDHLSPKTMTGALRRSIADGQFWVLVWELVSPRVPSEVSRGSLSCGWLSSHLMVPTYFRAQYVSGPASWHQCFFAACKSGMLTTTVSGTFLTLAAVAKAIHPPPNLKNVRVPLGGKKRLWKAAVCHANYIVFTLHAKMSQPWLQFICVLGKGPIYHGWLGVNENTIILSQLFFFILPQMELSLVTFIV